MSQEKSKDEIRNQEAGKELVEELSDYLKAKTPATKEEARFKMNLFLDRGESLHG